MRLPLPAPVLYCHEFNTKFKPYDKTAVHSLILVSFGVINGIGNSFDGYLSTNNLK